MKPTLSIHTSLVLLLCILCSAQLMGQVEGSITDASTGEPLPFVHVKALPSGTGTVSDIDGKFFLKPEPADSILEFSFIGYEKVRMPTVRGGAKLSISMSEKADKLQEVTVFPGENPAHRIIRNAVAQREKNKPENLPFFSYKTYSKFVATVNTDTIKPRIDTLYHPDIPDSIQGVDSSNFKLVNFFSKQHLFFIETVTERKYIRGKRDNERVLANRTSGFKNPRFALLNTELQSFSFYDDYVSISGVEYLNPLTPGSTGRYFFLLEDTSYTPAGDSIFIISYRPQPNKGFEALEGVLYIESRHWAIENVLARPADEEEIGIEIEQHYRLHGDSTWFPDQLNARLIFYNILVNGAYPEASSRTYLKDVNLNQPLAKKDISRATVSINDDVNERAPELLARYRHDSLNPREKRTYEFIDSLSEAENLEKRLAFIGSLAQGKIPLWFVDLDIEKLYRYNRAEGHRLGLGGHTNKRFSKWIKLGGYFAYGFRDKTSKYGWDFELPIKKSYGLALLGGYDFDIYETGGVNYIQRPQRSLFQSNYRLLYIQQWDEVSRYFAGFKFDPIPGLESKTLVQRSYVNTRGDYFFLEETEDGLQHNRGFNFFEVKSSLRWAPNEEYVEGPDFDLFALNQAFPVFYLQYTRGIEDVWLSEFAYDKIDLRVEHKFKTLFVGDIELSLQAGKLFQVLPYSKLYVGTGNLVGGNDFWDRFQSIADRHSFETMYYNEFVSDSYLHLSFRQDLKSLLFSRDWFEPHVELVGRALWGSLSQPELHGNVEWKTPRQGFYETGLELNRLLVSGLVGMGVGAYYRMGPYQFPDFEENLAVKLTLKISP